MTFIQIKKKSPHPARLCKMWGLSFLDILMLKPCGCLGIFVFCLRFLSSFFAAVSLYEL